MPEFLPLISSIAKAGDTGPTPAIPKIIVQTGKPVITAKNPSKLSVMSASSVKGTKKEGALKKETKETRANKNRETEIKNVSGLTSIETLKFNFFPRKQADTGEIRKILDHGQCVLVERYLGEMEVFMSDWTHDVVSGLFSVVCIIQKKVEAKDPNAYLKFLKDIDGAIDLINQAAEKVSKGFDIFDLYTTGWADKLLGVLESGMHVLNTATSRTKDVLINIKSLQRRAFLITKAIIGLKDDVQQFVDIAKSIAEEAKGHSEGIARSVIAPKKTTYQGKPIEEVDKKKVGNISLKSIKKEEAVNQLLNAVGYLILMNILKDGKFDTKQGLKEIYDEIIELVDFVGLTPEKLAETRKSIKDYYFSRDLANIEDYYLDRPTYLRNFSMEYYGNTERYKELRKLNLDKHISPYEMEGWIKIFSKEE